MTHILTWETVNPIHGNRIRLVVRSPNPQNGLMNVIDWVAEPLATTTTIWNLVKALKEMFPDLTWEDDGFISTIGQIEEKYKFIT